MKISDVRPGQLVRHKDLGKNYHVKGFAYPYNSLMAKRMVSLIGLTMLVMPSKLELIEDVQDD